LTKIFQLANVRESVFAYMETVILSPAYLCMYVCVCVCVCVEYSVFTVEQVLIKKTNSVRTQHAWEDPTMRQPMRVCYAEELVQA